MSRERELLQKIYRQYQIGNFEPKNRVCGRVLGEIEAELAKPESSGMTALDIRDDDALRSIQRVLESDAPDTDRKEARDKIVEIRTRVRGVAQPESEPTDFESPRPMQRLTDEEILNTLLNGRLEPYNHMISCAKLIMDAMIEKNR